MLTLPLILTHHKMLRATAFRATLIRGFREIPRPLTISWSGSHASAPKKRLDNFNPTPQEPPLSTQPQPPLATAPREVQSTPRIKQIAKLLIVLFGPTCRNELIRVLPDPCQPTAYLCPKAEDGNRRKNVFQRARQTNDWIISTLRRKCRRYRLSRPTSRRWRRRHAKSSPHQE
jgi:hypothetical protein